MTTVILLDPALVLEASDEQGMEQLLDWTSDRRVKLGIRSWQKIADDYANSALSVPRVLMRIAHRCLLDLLARSPLEHDINGSSAQVAPTYLGATGSHELLADDLKGTWNIAESVVLGSHPKFWASVPSVVSCDPPPPSELAIHLVPHLPSIEERRRAAEHYFGGRRVLIIGGQVESGVIATLVEQLGIDDQSVRWIPSEKNKRARDLDRVISGLPSTAIVVCVVGKVGHDVSGDIKRETGRRGLLLCESRFASQILDDLRKLVN